MNALQITMTKRPMLQMFLCALASASFISAGTIGYHWDQMTVALNLHIAAVAFVTEGYMLRFWWNFNREVSRSEASIRNCLGKQAHEILGLGRNEFSPIGLAVLQDVLTKKERGRGAEHGAILQAYETGLMCVPNLVSMIAVRVLPLSGMAGTLLGLIGAMIHAAEGIRHSTDPELLTASILPAIASLGTAFSTTLSSVLLGPLLIGLQAEHTKRAVQQFSDQLDAQLGSFLCASSQPPRKGSQP